MYLSRQQIRVCSDACCYYTLEKNTRIYFYIAYEELLLAKSHIHCRLTYYVMSCHPSLAVEILYATCMMKCFTDKI